MGKVSVEEYNSRGLLGYNATKGLAGAIFIGEGINALLSGPAIIGVVPIIIGGGIIKNSLEEYFRIIKNENIQ